MNAVIGFALGLVVGIIVVWTIFYLREVELENRITLYKMKVKHDQGIINMLRSYNDD